MNNEFLYWWLTLDKFEKNAALHFEKAPKSLLNFLREEEKLVTKFVDGKESIIDVGCGNGRAIPIVAPIVKKYFGIDSDLNCINEAKKFLEKHENVELILGDFKEFKKKLKKNQFDGAILLWNTLCLFEEPSKELKDIGETAKGNVFFSMPFKGALKQRIEYYNLLKEEYKVDYKTGAIHSKLWGKVPSYNKEEIEEITKESGLIVEKMCLFNEFAWIIQTRNP